MKIFFENVSYNDKRISFEGCTDGITIVGCLSVAREVTKDNNNNEIKTNKNNNNNLKKNDKKRQVSPAPFTKIEGNIKQTNENYEKKIHDFNNHKINVTNHEKDSKEENKNNSQKSEKLVLHPKEEPTHTLLKNDRISRRSNFLSAENANINIKLDANINANKNSKLQSNESGDGSPSVRGTTPDPTEIIDENDSNVITDEEERITWWQSVIVAQVS